MKTDKQFADEMVKVVLGIVGLMRPESKHEFDKASDFAAMLVETAVTEHVEQSLRASAEITKNGMEGK